MKFWQLPKSQRNHTAKRITQLRSNIEEYKGHVAQAKNLLATAEYNVTRTEKELNKMIAVFEDSDSIRT